MALLSTCNVIAGYGLKPARGGIRLQLNVVLNADEVIKGPDHHQFSSRFLSEIRTRLHSCITAIAATALHIFSPSHVTTILPWSGVRPYVPLTSSWKPSLPPRWTDEQIESSEVEVFQMSEPLASEVSASPVRSCV